MQEINLSLQAARFPTPEQRNLISVLFSIFHALGHGSVHLLDVNSLVLVDAILRLDSPLDYGTALLSATLIPHSFGGEIARW